ncbi:sensor histidine kinase [Leptolyngbya sp. PCC 6406]|uniref:sensor histidine kinase n=1 Tax=Leptolyngbya sp. PCC 6406 TaxID=1173264 RepID=UPI0002ACDAC6|nr:response regulator [Leptolyngbya sp. PCC 6406]
METNPTPQTILVVDDTPTNIQVLFDLLDASGYRVAIAKSGEIALKRLQSSIPDLILLDVMMPGIDGFETCQRIKAAAHTCDIPIIFMTALSDTLDKVKGLKLGAVDYITKPIQHEEVLARIKVHLQLRHLTQSLESQVASRTTDLQSALDQLQQTQLQLVQNEKMSSLGQLVAGVAHEINNPINFIYGNLQPAEDYIRDLLALVESYQTHVPNPPEAVATLAEDMDLDFLQTDLPRLIDSMKLGANRIRQIVLSLRNFSRLDESEVKAVDLHEGIDSTLLILHHRFKHKEGNAPAIEVIKNYGDLPLVECHASQLNQVFMNLISNAIDALEDRAKAEATAFSSPNAPPMIRIQTQPLDRDRVAIHIADNGPGIPESVQGQLFNAFFTTKGVGKGTGLGLSISYQLVVEKHQGRLFCRSTPGQGAEFVIELPIKQAQSQEASAKDRSQTIAPRPKLPVA